MRMKIELRKFPYPFRAALSICSDIDHTHPAEKFVKVQEFMNRDLGLTFTNTFYPFHDLDEFSLFSSRPLDRAILLEHLKNGKIEALHAFGEKKDFERADAEKTLAELKKQSVRLKMWIDHADFSGNFCKYRCPGRGDQPGCNEYHSDLTAAYGVKYIWTDRLTNIIGQGVPIRLSSLTDLLDAGHPVASGLNAAKTAVKLVLGFFKNTKYSFMFTNEPVSVTTLRDGRKMFEFTRFNNYFRGAARGDSFSELFYALSGKVLRTLVAREGYAIVYVHLGKGFGIENLQNRRTVQALQGLKTASDQGAVWVDSTLRQLEYYVKRTYLKWDFSLEGDTGCIAIHSIDDPVSGPYIPKPEDLSGLSFYVPDAWDVKIKINHAELKNTVVNAPDYSGRRSVSLP